MRRATLLLLVNLCATVGVSSAIASYQSRFRPDSQTDLKGGKKHITKVDPDMPIVDFDAPSENDPKLLSARKTKSIRYDQAGSYAIQDAPHITGRIRSSDWAFKLDALPVTASDVILVGHVIDRQAHLSNDRTAIYSEFELQVEEVFKDSSDALRPGVAISVERFGGAIRFPSGSVQKYITQGQGMPQQGKRYLFFLKRVDTANFIIITGYRLEEEKVFPLDGFVADTGNERYQFDKYWEADVTEFLNTLRAAIGRKGENSTRETK